MSTEIIYSNKAAKSLKKLERDPAKKIVNKIKFYANQDDILASAKKLQSPFNGLYRYRIGEYRVIFEIDAKGAMKILIVLDIKHRKDAYS